MDITLPAIDAFIDSLIAENLPVPRSMMPPKQISSELTERLNQYLALRTIEMVSSTNPEAVTKLAELIKTNPAPEEVQKFISNFVTQPDILVAQIFNDFRNLYIGAVKPQAH